MHPKVRGNAISFDPDAFADWLAIEESRETNPLGPRQSQACVTAGSNRR